MKLRIKSRRRAPAAQPRLSRGQLAADLGVRVGFVGGIGRRWLGGGVRVLDVQPDWVGDLALRCAGTLDVLVVDPRPEGFPGEALVALIDEARGLGAWIVGVEDGVVSADWSESPDIRTDAPPKGAGVPAWDGREDLRLGAGFVPAVDTRRVNPIGFTYATGGGWALTGEALLGGCPEPGLRAARDELAGAEPQVLLGNGSQLVRQLRDCVGVLDHATFHSSAEARAAHLAVLAAAGVPVVLLDELDEHTRSLLGADLAQALEAVSVQALRGLQDRERVSVALRRAALVDHSMHARWRSILGEAGIPVRRPPSVSVLLATNRAQYLAHALEQVDRQSYAPLELVVVLHGETFGAPPDLADRVRVPFQVLEVPGNTRFGDALNAGLDAASGDVVTKMDDDDWYGSAHVQDLITALDYSGAQLAGKAAEFVYLGELDITIRRFTDRAESGSRTIAGGALAIRREDLRVYGGWPRVRKSVDRTLIGTVIQDGGRVHRTHGYGYLLNRHGLGHTWSEDVDYFLAQSEDQRRGLDLTFAGCGEDGQLLGAGRERR